MAKKQIQAQDGGPKGGRAVAYVRTNGDPNGKSAVLQKQLIASWCEENLIRLSDTFEDLNCPDDAPLEKRTGLARALNALASTKSTMLVAIDQAQFTLVDSEGVIIETLATERYGAELAVMEGSIDWGTDADSMREIIGAYIECARKLDDALQNDDSPDEWEHVQTAANLSNKMVTNPETGRQEKATLRWIADELAKRNMLSKQGNTYAPIQISRMLEKAIEHQQGLNQQAKEMADRLAAEKAVKAKSLIVVA